MKTMFNLLSRASMKATYLLAAGDPFNSINKLTSDTIPKIQFIATGVFALVLVVTGLVYAVSGQELKSKIKKKWVDVGVGVLIVYGAVMGVTWLIQFAQSSGLN